MFKKNQKHFSQMLLMREVAKYLIAAVYSQLLIIQQKRQYFKALKLFKELNI